MSNTNLITTGVSPLCVGSVEKFQLQAALDSLPWDLTGGTVTLTFRDPTGVQTVYPASISGGCAFVTWTVIDPPGDWRRTWTVTDAAGIHQVSQPVPFTVIDSP
jgi:hypothetical protein